MKAHDQIITELQAKIKYHHICIDELNDRMNSIMEIKKNKGVNKLTCSQITGQDKVLPRGWKYE